MNEIGYGSDSMQNGRIVRYYCGNISPQLIKSFKALAGEFNKLNRSDVFQDYRRNPSGEIKKFPQYVYRFVCVTPLLVWRVVLLKTTDQCFVYIGNGSGPSASLGERLHGSLGGSSLVR